MYGSPRREHPHDSLRERWNYVKQAAGSPGAITADQLSKLAGLKSQGLLTDAEFEAEKSKVLASA